MHHNQGQETPKDVYDFSPPAKLISQEGLIEEK